MLIIKESKGEGPGGFSAAREKGDRMTIPGYLFFL